MELSGERVLVAARRQGDALNFVRFTLREPEAGGRGEGPSQAGCGSDG